jgi:catechol 2,3-dioxygenase-like lactoylglutathione lyase family enzyme
MSWSVNHVTISSYDLERSARFYREVFGMEASSFERSTHDSVNLMDADHFRYYVDGSGVELHVARPVPEFERRNGVHINPTVNGHFALTVDDLEATSARMEAARATWAHAGRIGPAGRERLYVYDPYMNVIEVNQAV